MLNDENIDALGRARGALSGGAPTTLAASASRVRAGSRVRGRNR
jgi:hypothetical protein